MKSKFKYLFATTVLAGSIGVSGAAQAQQTAAEVVVTNTVTVDYSVGSTPQPQLTATNDFTVDRLVVFNLIEFPGDGRTNVVPGETDQPTSFQLTNSSNDSIRFRFTADNLTSDDFDVTSIRVFQETNGTPGFQIGGDTDVTAVAIPALADGGSTILYIVANIPGTGQNNGDVSDVQLTAIPVNDTASADLQDDAATPNGEDTVENVFDVANIIENAQDGYIVAGPDLTQTPPAKFVRVVWDPVNLLVNPKAIPGAVLEYCITLTNTGQADATNVNVGDVVPGDLTLSGLPISGVAATTDQIFAGGNGGPDVNGVCTRGPAVGTAADPIAATLDVPVGTTRNVVFQAVIN